MKTTRFPSFTPRLLQRRGSLSLAAAVAAVLAGAPGAFAQFTGEFSAANLGNGNFDALVGLSTTKTYLYAIDVGVGAANLTINGVNFTGLAGANPSVVNQWSLTGVGNTTNTGANNITGQLGTLATGFVYGSGTTAEVLTVSALTIGQTYVITFYNRAFDPETTGRRQTMSASGASVAGSGGFTFDEDLGAAAAGSLNVLRYTFQASTVQQIVNFVAQVSGTTMHQYGFSVESVFNNTYTSGADWTMAVWSGGVPNAQGRSAAFAAVGAPSAINLDADVTAGHVQFDGTNAWTLGTSSGRTLTLQTDVGGVSTLSAKAGSHTISTNIALLNNVMKVGAGALTLSGSVSGAASVHLAGGTLSLTGSNSYTGETVIAGGGTLNVTTLSDYGLPSSIGARASGQENNTVTGVGLHFQGGTLKFIGSTAQSTNRNFRMLNGATGATIDASGTVPGATLSFTHTGANQNLFDTGGTRTLTLTGTNTGDNAFSIQLTNQSTNATSLTKTNIGTWVLNGPDANTATGTTTVSNGQLTLAKTGVNAVGGPLTIGNASTRGIVLLSGTGGNQIADTSVVTFTGGGSNAGTLRTNNLSETIGGLSSSVAVGIVENESGSTGTGTLTVNVASGTQLFAGLLRNGDGVGTDGTLALTKTGAGTQAIAGVQTYTGATTVVGGLLSVDGSLAAGSAVGVTGGALGGIGTVNGPVTVNATGRISPATATTAGTLTLNSLSLASGSLLDFEFGGTSDLVNVTSSGGLAINGGAFNLYTTGGVTPLTANGTYTLLDYNTSFTGALSNLGVANAQVGKFYAINNDAVNTLIKLTVADAISTEWNGNAANGIWTTDGNWTALAANAPGALAKFGTIPGGPTNVAVNGAKTAGSIIFDNANGYSLTSVPGDSITLDNGIATPGISVLSGNHSIAAPVLLLGNTTVTTATGTTLTISGDISGAKSFTAAGSGTTVLSGTNSFTATNVTGGTLQIGDGAGTGTPGSGDVTLAAGTTLLFNRSNDIPVGSNILGASAQVTKNGAGILTLSGANTFGTMTVNAGTVKLGSATAIPAALILSLNGTLDLNQNNATVSSLSGTGGTITDNGTGGLTTPLTVNQAGTTTFDGIIANGADRLIALTKTGAGTLTLAGASANSYSGVTTVTGGVLTLAKTGGNAIVGNIAIGDAAGSDVVLLGASDQIADTSVLSFTAGASGSSAFFHLNGFNETVKGIQTTLANAAVIANASASGPSTLTVDTAGSSYTYDGIIRNGSTGLMAITKAGNGTLTLANTAKVVATNYTGDTIVNGGRLVISNLDVFTSAITINSPDADALTFNQTTKSLTVAALISGSGALTVNAGANTLTLSGANSGLNGLVTLNSGTLGIGANGALGNGSILINGGNIRAAGAARNLFNPVTAAGSFIVGRLTDFSGSFTLAANVTITADNFDGLANGDSRFNTGIDGPFAVTFAEGPHLIGTGALVVAAVNTNSGGTIVASGRVTVEAAGALANAPLTVNGGLLNLNNAVQDVTALSGTGGVVNLAAGNTLKTTQTVDTSYAGTLQGDGGLRKAGSGKLTLSGAETYLGDTNVDDGALIVTGTLTDTIVNVNTATAIVRFAASQTLPALNIADGATVIVSELPPPALPGGGDAQTFGAPGGDLAGDAVQAVPEPGSAALIFGGLATLLGRRRRGPK